MQLNTFVLLQPDPDVEAIDAFSMDWTRLNFYAFHSFCLIGKCLQNVMLDRAEGIMIVLNWPMQVCFSRLAEMLIDNQIVLSISKHLVTKPALGKLHPLHSKLCLLWCRWSEDTWRHEAFLKMLAPSSSSQIELRPTNSTSPFEKWSEFCNRQNLDTVRTSVNLVLDFLLYLHRQGLNYSTINMARCALSHLSVCQLMKCMNSFSGGQIQERNL